MITPRFQIVVGRGLRTGIASHTIPQCIIAHASDLFIGFFHGFHTAAAIPVQELQLPNGANLHSGRRKNFSFGINGSQLQGGSKERTKGEGHFLVAIRSGIIALDPHDSVTLILTAFIGRINQRKRIQAIGSVRKSI